MNAPAAFALFCAACLVSLYGGSVPTNAGTLGLGACLLAGLAYRELAS